MRPKINQLVEGDVIAWTPVGVFVELEEAPEFSSLLHVTEVPGLSDYMPDDMYPVGKHLTALRVIRADEDSRKISLSLKPLLDG